MSFELTGKIVELYDTQQFSGTFKKREFVLEKTEYSGDRTFTDLIKFQATQDRSNLLDAVKKGDMVKVSFNIRGSKWDKDGKTSYFVNLDVWRVEKIAQENDLSYTPVQQQQQDQPFIPDVEDDLPF